MAKKRIGVILCGCGHRDGSEVHEATLTLLAVDQAGAESVCFAPSGNMRFVRDHLTGESSDDTRSMIVESARIARGNIQNLTAASHDKLDALIIPGGQGAGLNLSTFLIDGTQCSVLPDVSRIIVDMARAGKPIGGICIAPATIARALGQAGISAKLTCGTDADVACAIEEMGHKHENCEPSNCVVDMERKIVTTPAYMSATTIGEVWQGVSKLVRAVVEMA